MSVILVITGILLCLGSLLLLFSRESLSAVAAFLGLACFYFTDLLPLNLNIIITWLCLTVVVTGVSLMQPPAVMTQHRGMGHITIGGIAGMAVGLLGFSMTRMLTAVYAIMIVATAAGIFFGYFMFTRTPAGRAVNMRSGRFFTYLLAKGFPVMITVSQIGVILILALLPRLLNY